MALIIANLAFLNFTDLSLSHPFFVSCNLCVFMLHPDEKPVADAEAANPSSRPCSLPNLATNSYQLFAASLLAQGIPHGVLPPDV